MMRWKYPQKTLQKLKILIVHLLTLSKTRKRFENMIVDWIFSQTHSIFTMSGTFWKIARKYQQGNTVKIFRKPCRKRFKSNSEHYCDLYQRGSKKVENGTLALIPFPITSNPSEDFLTQMLLHSTGNPFKDPILVALFLKIVHIKEKNFKRCLMLQLI